MNSEDMQMAPWRDPFRHLQSLVRRMIWITGIYMTIVTLIAVSGVSIAWYALHKQVEQNADALIAMCRQNNMQNHDLRVVLLSFGVTNEELHELRPIICDREAIEERFGRK